MPTDFSGGDKHACAACEDWFVSFFEKGQVSREQRRVSDLVTAAVLHRGLISGYTAPLSSFRLLGQRLSGQEI